MNHELTLRDYLAVLWSGRRLLFTIIAVAVIIGAIVAFTRPAEYTATSELSLGQATTLTGQPAQTPETHPLTAPGVLKNDTLVAEVATELDVKPKVVRRGVELSSPRAIGVGNQPTILTVRATNENKARSIDMANAYAEAVLTQVRESYDVANGPLEQRAKYQSSRIEALDREVVSLRRQLIAAAGTSEAAVIQASLISAQNQIDLARAYAEDAERAVAKAEQIEAPSKLTVAESAVSSGTPAKRVRQVILAAIIGLLVGIAAVFVWKGSPARRAASDAPKKQDER